VYESAPGFLFPGASKACFCKWWGIKGTCEWNEYGLLLVKHPQNGTRDPQKAESNTTPATKNPLKVLISEGFSFYADKTAGKY